ncbi:hypothetical protein [Halococcoides cellulosivorans]|uniref:hypothetical protein n=1 Tax=Halococcoides cellulosivorans TaxID=1679096 RepID=UPI00131EE4FF|nr:hypothetical protein [Halococcoides cellulosivorans]
MRPTSRWGRGRSLRGHGDRRRRRHVRDHRLVGVPQRGRSPWNGRHRRGDGAGGQSHASGIDDVVTASDGHVRTQWATLGVNESVATIPGGKTGSSPPIDGSVPADIDDGMYEDLNGDGEVNFPDVNTLFQNLGTDAVSNNARLFDFESGNGVTLQDVLALFESV